MEKQVERQRAKIAKLDERIGALMSARVAAEERLAVLEGRLALMSCKACAHRDGAGLEGQCPSCAIDRSRGGGQ